MERFRRFAHFKFRRRQHNTGDLFLATYGWYRVPVFGFIVCRYLTGILARKMDILRLYERNLFTDTVLGAAVTHVYLRTT